MKIKQPVHLLCSLISALILSSCGEDRSGEYAVLIKQDQWIYNTMKDVYLWYYDIPDESGLSFVAIPKDFFPKLLSKKTPEGKQDKYSYIEMLDTERSTRSISQESTYGFDFQLYSDPTSKTSNKFARVLFVLPDSPAAEAGLKRGNWISGVNKEKLTSNNSGYLIQGDEARFATAVLTLNKDSAYVWTNLDTITVKASHPVENYPFYIDSVYEEGAHRIAYLMYNSFSTGPDDDPYSEEYNNEMRSIFSRFKGSGITDMILDLRYNPGGYLSCSQVLASILTPSSALGQVYCSLSYNNKHTENDYSLSLDANLTGGANMNLNKLYVITSNLTASASEAVIYCLKPYMEVITIGTTTEGKNVGSQPYKTAEYPSFILHPIVAYLLNANGQTEYYNGIKPDWKLDEFNYLEDFYPLGDIKERMLKNTLSLITTGTMPDGKQTETPSVSSFMNRNGQIVKMEYNSLERKKVNGVLLPPNNK